MDNNELSKQIELLDEEELDEFKNVLNKTPQELTIEEKHFIESIFNKPFEEITEQEITQTKASINPLFKGLIELDAMLQKAVDAVDKAFDSFDNLEDASIKYAQDKIDKACIQISDKINTSLEKKKKDVCNALKKKYKQVLESMTMLKPIIDLLSLNISLDTIVSGLIQTITAFAQPYIKPYQDAIKFIAEFIPLATPLIKNIADNTEKLLGTPDRAKERIQNINPNLNTDKLQISFTPPNIQDIIG